MNPITADRLVLRALHQNDAPYFLQYLPEIDQFLSLKAPVDIIEAEKLVAQYLVEEKEGSAVRFVIEDKKTNGSIKS